MTTQPSLILDVVPYILNAVNAANPLLPAPLTELNVTVGTPASMPTPTAGGINTSLALTGIAGSGYTNAVTIYYPRMDLGAQYPQGITTVGDGVESWGALANAINAACNTKLSAADFPATPFEIDTLPTALTVTIAPTSLLYLGTITVSLSGSQPSLATAIAVTALSGLSIPASQLAPLITQPVLNGFTTAQLVPS